MLLLLLEFCDAGFIAAGVFPLDAADLDDLDELFDDLDELFDDLGELELEDLVLSADGAAVRVDSALFCFEALVDDLLEPFLGMGAAEWCGCSIVGTLSATSV